MEVTVKGSNMIFPAQHTPKVTHWISNLDMVQATFHVPLLFFYKPYGSPQPQLLKEALSKTLVPFYPMAGRLGCDENGRFQITCNAEGVLWIEAETSSVIDDLAGFTPCSQLQKLVPTLDCSGDTTSYPLFMAQITQNQLNTLKAKSWEHGNKTNYSMYTILAAYIWRCATKARGLSYDQPTRLLMPTNGRPRLHPPLPSSYLGNVIFMASSIALSGNLQSEPFVNTLGRVHGALARMDNEYLRSAIDYLETLPDIKAARGKPETYQCPSLFINKWSRLPLHDADFGWGRPLYAGPPNVVSEGQIFLVPSPTDDGSLSLVACLQTPHMKPFEEQLYQGLTSSENKKARY